MSSKHHIALTLCASDKVLISATSQLEPWMWTAVRPLPMVTAAPPLMVDNRAIMSRSDVINLDDLLAEINEIDVDRLFTVSICNKQLFIYEEFTLVFWYYKELMCAASSAPTNG